MRATAARPAPRAGRVPFALVCCVLIAATMAALLALNIASAQASYSQDALQARLTRLGEEQQALRERLELDKAPDALERRATAQGMVRSGGTAFLSLRDGKVLGEPAPAPTPTPGPTASDGAPLPDGAPPSPATDAPPDGSAPRATTPPTDGPPPGDQQ